MDVKTSTYHLQTIKLDTLLRELEQHLMMMETNILIEAEPYDADVCAEDWLYCQRKFTARERTARRHLIAMRQCVKQASGLKVPSIDKCMWDLKQWRIIH